MSLPTVSSVQTSERAKRLAEELHEPFDNEKRWFIIEAAFDSLREDIGKALKNPPYGMPLAEIVRQVK